MLPVARCLAQSCPPHHTANVSNLEQGCFVHSRHSTSVGQVEWNSFKDDVYLSVSGEKYDETGHPKEEILRFSE